MTEPTPLKHLWLVDGSGYIFRAFHALPMMTRADGTPVNAVYGFTAMLIKLLQDRTADHLAVIFDASERTFRNEIYPEYKAHRPETPPELAPQFSLVRDATRALGVPAIELNGFEADDLIASYARRAEERGARVTIISSDKDLMQLVGDSISMFDPIKARPIGAAEVFEKFGVDPGRVIDVQALAGDPTDNVPGVPGIGVKTAAALITEYGDLDTLLARAGEIKQPKRRETLLANIENARISRDLVTLKCDVPLPQPLEELVARPTERSTLFAFLDAQGFRTLRNRAEILPLVDGPVIEGGAPVVVEPPQAKPVSYELVTTEAALAAWVHEAARAGRVVVGTETDTPDPFRGRLAGISLAVAPGRACYIPLLHTLPPPSLDFAGAGTSAAPEILALDRAIALLKPLLEDLSVLKIGHNIKFDMQVLAGVGIDVTPIEDVMILSYVLDGSSHGHGKDDLAQLFLDQSVPSYASVCGTGKNQLTFDRVPFDKARDYAAGNAEAILRVYQMLKPRLLAERMVTVYESMDRPLIPVLALMERTGIVADKRELAQMSAEFGDRLKVLEKQIHAAAGVEFNPGSPKQLGEILFDKLTLPGGKKSSKTGAYATGADVLEALAPLHELPRLVLEWRQLSKLKSTYADALIEEINPATGRVHTSYAMTVANTGRLSSQDPNLQNIPIRTDEGRRIRRAFVAAPGHVLLSADYSQIELRLVAHVANIERLKQAFREGKDIHAITASEVFGVPVQGMDPMLRRRAKAINFGIIYGISAFGLANQLGIPQGEARAYIEAYFARYPEIRAYMETVKQEAREKGHVMTLFGRKCFIPGIADKNPAMRAFSERAAINAPIQGGAADIIKRAMVHLPRILGRAGLSARMLLQVHDELVFEVPEEELEATATLARTEMEQAATLSVPLVVETGHARSWAEAH